MAYDWNAEADGEGASERLQVGICRVTGKKVVTGKGSGTFKTTKGDPYIMLVVEDAVGQEGSVVFTLSDKAGWTLAKWMSRCGVDLNALKTAGIQPQHFTNPDIAKQYLVGKSCWVKVDPAPAGREAKYVQITPLKEEEALGTPRPAVATVPAGGHPNPHPDFNLDDIPFAVLLCLGVVPFFGA